MKVMYGLFEYSYDYYEWEELIGVATTVGALEQLYLRQESRYPLSTEDKHEVYARIETCHFLIKQVHFLG